MVEEGSHYRISAISTLVVHQGLDGYEDPMGAGRKLGSMGVGLLVK